MRKRTEIKWTRTAAQCLRSLPFKVQQNAYRKVHQLQKCDDPRHAHKPLASPLSGLYSIKCGRYRVLYSVDEKTLANGDRVLTVIVRVLFAGMRKEGDKRDVYALARKLLKFADRDADQPEPDQFED